MGISIFTGAAGRALDQLAPLAALPKDVARPTINGARDDIAKALGTVRQKSFSPELHAAINNMHSGIAGGATQVRTALAELERSASHTAAKRAVIATGVVTLAGVAAVAAAVRGGDAGRIMAPGPFESPGAPSADPSGERAQA